jgi:hypothetical protein
LGYNKIEEEIMEKIKTLVQKLWLDHKTTAIAVIVGIVIGAIIF